MTATLKAPALTRRGVLAGIGGMTFSFAFGTDGTHILPAAGAATGPIPLSPWVRIMPDGNITILTDRDGAGLRHRDPADDRRRNGRRLGQGRARMGAIATRTLWLAGSQ